jgi:pimeloyl-ACP methyl ester carboxylesterase
MNDPRLCFVQCLDVLGMQGLHRMAYWEWGNAQNPNIVVCVHGLSRQGRDFDTLARSLASEFRVICPDLPGRGHSDWLSQPSAYVVPTYLADMVTLLAKIDAHQLFWIGTSLGGLVGMGLASLKNQPIAKLVLNDIGPQIEFAALQRIGAYLGAAPIFATESEAIDYLSSISQSFGPHTPEQWTALCRPLLRPVGQGKPGFRLHYDPAIAVAFKAVTPELAAQGQAQAWRAYETIECPTLLLRGADSDLLSRETAQAMTEKGPRARLIEWPSIGHAPTLIDPAQIQAVKDFLQA